MNADDTASDSFRTADAVRLLGVPEHVVRHWLRSLRILEPRRSFGRHHYTVWDLALLLRIRHLVRQHRLDLAESENRLIAERSGRHAELAARVMEIRVELVEAWLQLRRLGNSQVSGSAAGRKQADRQS